MPKNSAEYQRLYRARKKAALKGLGETQDTFTAVLAGARAMQESVNALGAGKPNAHAQCDARIAELEAEVARLREGKPWPPPQRVALPPHMEVAGFCGRDGQEWPCVAAILAPPEQSIPVPLPVQKTGLLPTAVPPSRPSFLAAPDDDCPKCGHDRHANLHTAGPCQFPVGRRRCLCSDFDLGFG